MTSTGLLESSPSAARKGWRTSVKLAVTIVPGLIVFTRIPSAARLLARFFETLATAALDAVYATIRGFWRWIEWAAKLTTRAHSAARRSGNAARVHRTAAIKPSWKA